MKRIKSLFLPFLISGAIVLTVSSFVINKVKPVENSNVKIEKVKSLISSFTADGTDLSYSELVTIGTTLKGDKLNLKEKATLKLMRKKISTNLIKNQTNSGAEKSQLIALLICFFVGGLGIHRFYLGYTWQGVVQLLTGGGCGIWALIDLIRIITGSLKPKDGEYDKSL